MVVCEISGVDVVYFGYGFFVENVKFVDIFEVYGISFIGFEVDYICLMGDKINVKVVVERVGILVVFGFVGVILDIDDGKCVVVDIGYLVFVKVVVGGGGCGMKVVEIE